MIEDIHRNNVNNENLGWEKGVYPSDDFLQNSLIKGELYTLTEKDVLYSCVILSKYNIKIHSNLFLFLFEVTAADNYIKKNCTNNDHTDDDTLEANLCMSKVQTIFKCLPYTCTCECSKKDTGSAKW